ncbi:hypothetical protein ACWDBD_17065 [Streptomyces sp. NPDC001118]
MIDRIATAAPALVWAAAVLAAGIWAIAHSIRAGRRHNDQQAAWLTVCNGERPEPGQPGTDQHLLEQCTAICPELTRKEKP